MLILRSIGLLDIEIPRKEIISTDGRTDRRTARQTDGRTDRRRARQQQVVFWKKEKTTKNQSSIEIYDAKVPIYVV